MCLFFLIFTILVILYDSDKYIARSPLYPPPPSPISHYTNISDRNEKQKQTNILVF